MPQAFLAGLAADEGVFGVAEHVVEGGAEPADLGVWGGVGEGSGMAISPLARGSPAIVRPTVWTLT